MHGFKIQQDRNSSSILICIQMGMACVCGTKPKISSRISRVWKHRYNLDRNPAITGTGYFSTPSCNVGRFNNAEYVYIVRRDVGSFLIYDQKLVYIDTFNPAKNQKIVAVCAVPAHSGGEYSFIRLSLLGPPWDTDYGIATDRLAGARTAGDTFEHEADCLIEAEIDTIPSSDQIELRFRIQDANNYWRVTIDSSGNIDLDEVVSGSPTQRGTSAGVISNSDRIVIIADDETIKVYEANNLRITYTSAANFKTATSGELETEGTGGAVSDIVSWPRALSGAALAALEAV